MKKFINNLKYEIRNSMTEEEMEFIDLEDRLYVEFGKDPTYEDIEKVIETLEKGKSFLKIIYYVKLSPTNKSALLS